MGIAFFESHGCVTEIWKQAIPGGRWIYINYQVKLKAAGTRPRERQYSVPGFISVITYVPESLTGLDEQQA